jgi:cell division protein FtsB
VVHKSEHIEDREAQGEFLRPLVEAKKSRWGFRGMTVRDWLELLLVPLLLGIFATGLTAWFNAQQDARQTEIEEQRAETERQIEEQRAQDAALQAYLDQTSRLLIEEDLRNAQPKDNVSVATRARTLTVLGRLDGEHKRSVLLFLHESGLLRKGDDLVVDLSGADLSGTDLSGAHLPNIDLASPYHYYSYWAQFTTGVEEGPQPALPDVDLSGANLEGAVLTGAHLRNVDLTGADLTNAVLEDTNLSGARGVTDEQLEQQALSLEGATMPNGQKYEDWLESHGEDGENSGPS